MDWNIDIKLSTITSCSINNAMIEKIKVKLNSETLLRDEALLHMRCVYILILIISPHRNQLHWTNFESLMYVRSWL